MTIDMNALAMMGGVATQMPTLETSMSGLDTWTRCDRRFWYRYIRGLVPIAVNENLQWGTFWHRIAQEYYRSLQNHAREDAALSNAQRIAEGLQVVENANHGDTVLTLDNQARETIWDTFMYYYDNAARYDEWDEIIDVEDSVYMVLGVGGVPFIKIRSTFDLVARKNGRRYIVDHKTTGDVEKNYAYLSKDFQCREYALSARNFYQEDVTLVQNIVARDVPPGFGHRSLLTDTGKQRNAATLESMQRKEKYLKREFLTYSNEQYQSFEQELLRMSMLIQVEMRGHIWPRRIVKMGGMSCDSCPYDAICTAELDHEIMSDASPLITMAFTKDPIVGKMMTPSRILMPQRFPG